MRSFFVRSFIMAMILAALGAGVALAGAPASFRAAGSRGEVAALDRGGWPGLMLQHSGRRVRTCHACHTDDTEVGTSVPCEQCHRQTAPDNHRPIPFSCRYCHSPLGWSPVSMKHQAAKATDCRGCHASLAPAKHYAPQCSACHNTRAFKPATFNHAAVGATDCRGCHGGAKPASHGWGNQCSDCHTPGAWKPASFNHSAVGATDCRGCHSGVKPASHTWDNQCSDCHTPGAWKPASFNHSAVGATDCRGCHSGAKPASHWWGNQCSDCHNTGGWQPASFNHRFNMNHEGAGGRCSVCHQGDGSVSCTACHANGAPSEGGRDGDD